MKLLKPGDPCPCCGRPIKEGLPTGTMIFLSWLAEGMALRKAAVPNEPLTCDGCYWQTHGSFGQCFDCIREKTDNYRRPPEGEEDT